MVNTGLSTSPHHDSTPTSSIHIRDPTTHSPLLHLSIPSNFTIDNPFKHPQFLHHSCTQQKNFNVITTFMNRKLLPSNSTFSDPFYGLIWVVFWAVLDLLFSSHSWLVPLPQTSDLFFFYLDVVTLRLSPIHFSLTFSVHCCPSFSLCTPIVALM